MYLIAQPQTIAIIKPKRIELTSVCITHRDEAGSWQEPWVGVKEKVSSTASLMFHIRTERRNARHSSCRSDYKTQNHMFLFSRHICRFLKCNATSVASVNVIIQRRGKQNKW